MESKNDKEVFIDTNFFMIPFQFNIDIIEELKKTLPAYTLVTTNFVIKELVGLKYNSKGKTRLAAGLGLKIAKSNEIIVKNIPLNKNESVDDGLIRIANVLATNDVGLKKKAKANNLTYVYLRQKRYLDVKGNIY